MRVKAVTSGPGFGHQNVAVGRRILLVDDAEGVDDETRRTAALGEAQVSGDSFAEEAILPQVGIQVLVVTLGHHSVTIWTLGNVFDHAQCCNGSVVW